MIRPHHLSLLIVAAAALSLGMLGLGQRPVPTASELAANPSKDNDALAEQIKELQKQVADLQSKVNDSKTPRIVAAGTATIKLRRQQDNKTNIRVKLPADVVALLGGKCIVQLTNRYPTGGSFFVAYWRPATDGFDILVANPALIGIGIINDNEPYYVDWIVVQKEK